MLATASAAQVMYLQQQHMSLARTVLLRTYSSTAQTTSSTFGGATRRVFVLLYYCGDRCVMSCILADRTAVPVVSERLLYTQLASSCSLSVLQQGA
jgi:hypothetical protein